MVRRAEQGLKRGTLRVRRVLGGKVYQREVTMRSWVVTDEAMRLKGVCLRQIVNLIKTGQLHPKKLGGRLYFAVGELLKKRPRDGR